MRNIHSLGALIERTNSASHLTDDLMTKSTQEIMQLYNSNPFFRSKLAVLLKNEGFQPVQAYVAKRVIDSEELLSTLKQQTDSKSPLWEKKLQEISLLLCKSKSSKV
jgi:hypothetical protein